MTLPDDEPRQDPSLPLAPMSDSDAPATAAPSDAIPAAAFPEVPPRVVCRYLLDVAGPWRRIEPSRNHRCDAVEPPAAIPSTTQRRICLTEQHVRCQAFVAAGEARAATLEADHIRLDRLRSSRFGSLVRPLPVALASGTSAKARDRIRERPHVGPIALIVVLVVAGLVGLALLPPPGAILGGAATGSPPAESPTAFTATGAPSARASLSPSRAPASPTPAGTALPVGVRRYVVVEGDRLGRIARRFGTTAAAIVELNDLADERPRITPGQRLLIPPP